VPWVASPSNTKLRFPDAVEQGLVIARVAIQPGGFGCG